VDDEAGVDDGADVDDEAGAVPPPHAVNMSTKTMSRASNPLFFFIIFSPSLSLNLAKQKRQNLYIRTSLTEASLLR